MKVVAAALMFASLVGTAHAQSTPVPRYGETDNVKTPSEIESERQADKAYKQSLGNIPNVKSSDPWGDVRGDGTPKSATKTNPVKRAKPATPAN